MQQSKRVRISASGGPAFGHHYKAQSKGIIRVQVNEGLKVTGKGYVKCSSEILGHLLRDDEEGQIRVLHHAGFVERHTDSNGGPDEQTQWPQREKRGQALWEILVIPKALIEQTNRYAEAA